MRSDYGKLHTHGLFPCRSLFFDCIFTDICKKPICCLQKARFLQKTYWFFANSLYKLSWPMRSLVSSSKMMRFHFTLDKKYFSHSQKRQARVLKGYAIFAQTPFLVDRTIGRLFQWFSFQRVHAYGKFSSLPKLVFR